MKWVTRYDVSRARSVPIGEESYPWAVESQYTTSLKDTPKVVACWARNLTTAEAIAAALNLVILGEGAHRVETLVRCANMERDGDKRPSLGDGR